MRFLDAISDCFKRYPCRVRRVEETFDLKWANRFTFKFTISEAIKYELNKSEMGGVIVFSTDVNASLGDTNPIVRWFKSKYQTWVNRLTRASKVMKAVKQVGASGFSIGNLFKGRYVSDSGQVFDEKSLSVEVLFISHKQLIDLATLICQTFNQESVLVKDNSNGKIYFVDGIPPKDGSSGE